MTSWFNVLLPVLILQGIAGIAFISRMWILQNTHTNRLLELSDKIKQVEVAQATAVASKDILTAQLSVLSVSIARVETYLAVLMGDRQKDGYVQPRDTH